VPCGNDDDVTGSRGVVSRLFSYLPTSFFFFFRFKIFYFILQLFFSFFGHHHRHLTEILYPRADS
jgi:hypothetical protein